MSKKILALCLSVILTLSAFGGFSVSAENLSVDVKLLIDLGVVEPIDESGLIPKGYTRGDFARSLNLMDKTEPANFKLTAEGAPKYAEDIEGNENFNHIATVIAIGYMKTDEAGCFRPGHNLTLNDAVYALVHALGYEPLAKRLGNTSSAYMSVANKIGLMRGVKVNDINKLGLNETAKLLANAMGIRFFSESGINLEEACFYDRWDLTQNSGRILANSNLGIMVEKAPKHKINIDGEHYYTKLLVADEIVGSDITYYTTEGDFGTEVVSISVKKASNNVSIEAKSIFNAEEKGDFVVITTEDEEEYEVLKSGFAIVNGKTVTPTVELFGVVNSGTITFIGGTDGCEIVHITSMLQSVIDGVNADSETLSIRFENQKIELSKLDSYEVYLNGKASSLKELSSDMTAGIACDSFSIVNGEMVYDYENAKYIKIFASKKVGSGIVETISDDGLYADGMSYAFGSGYSRLLNKGYINAVNIGDYVKLYLDMYDEIVYFETDTSKSRLKYGYLIAADAKDTVFDNVTRARIMDPEGHIHTYATAEKLVLDGAVVTPGVTSYVVGNETVDLTKRQIIRYRAEDGILKEIDTLTLRASAESEENSLNADLTFDPYADGGTKVKISRNVVARKYAFSADCVVFLDEALMDDTNPQDFNFSVMKAADIETECYIAGYDANDDNIIPCAVVWSSYGMSEEVQTNKALHYYNTKGLLVEKITESINDDGEDGYKIYLAGNGVIASYFIKPDNLKLYETKSVDDWVGEYMTLYSLDANKILEYVSAGDVVRIKANSHKEITYMERVFDFSSHKDTFQPVPESNGQLYGYAKVEKINQDFIIYSYGDGQKYMSNRSTSYGTLPVYYVKTGKVQLMSLADVPSAATGNDVRVFLRVYDYGLLQDNIMYVFD